jgi:hypothetical protein
MLRWALLVGLVVNGVASGQTRPASQPILLLVQDVAARVPWLEPGDALYDRDSTGPDPGDTRALMQSLQGRWSVDEIRPLLKNADPKVRTLGIILLFDLERLDVLPDIASLVADDAQTFPQPQRLSVRRRGNRPWPMWPASVSQYAQLVMRIYLDASGGLGTDNRSPWPRPDDTNAWVGLTKSFARARDPELSTAALFVSMQRATGAMSPLQPERAARVQLVLRKLDRVPMPRRFYAAIKLSFDRYRGEAHTPDYLLMLAREVPRELRLQTLRGPGRGIDDPDLPAGFGGDYFLEHAVDLLVSSDSDWLLQAEQNQRKGSAAPRSMPYSSYVVAAAMLRPQSADQILKAALTKFSADYEWDDRTKIATALAQLGSPGGVDTAIDWFFREPPRPGAYGFGREAFLERLHDRDPIRYRHVVARIVKDTRLSNLGPASTRILVTTVEGYLGKRLSTDDEIRMSYGIDEAQRDQKFASLEKWHQALRATLGEWDR